MAVAVLAPHCCYAKEPTQRGAWLYLVARPGVFSMHIELIAMSLPLSSSSVADVGLQLLARTSFTYIRDVTVVDR